MAFSPTPEQQKIVDASRRGESFKIDAKAGAGKTSTLVLIAEANPSSRIVYLAYNKAIADDAGRRFPSNVEARTAHSLAFRNIPKSLTSRLAQSGSQLYQSYMEYFGSNRDIQTVLSDIVFNWKNVMDNAGKDISVQFVRKQVMSAIRAVISSFEQSADGVFHSGHFPFQTFSILKFLANTGMSDGSTGKKPFRESRIKAAEKKIRSEIVDPCVSLASSIWFDSIKPGSTLPISHDTYLKVFVMEKPKLPFDLILFDEAQDANAVLLDLVENQKEDVRKIFVGDPHQQIYSWRGAVNAMQSIPLPSHPLCQSFRFGPEMANYANRILDSKRLAGQGEILPVRGTEDIKTVIDRGPVSLSEVDAILCRTNAGVVAAAIGAIGEGLTPYIVGGSETFALQLDEAWKLKTGQFSSHPEYSMFTSWKDLEAFSDTRDGASYKVIVSLVEKYKEEIPSVIEKIRNETSPAPSSADLTISTAHRSKGLEWDRVLVWDDFREFVRENQESGEISFLEEECNLCYVTATRAKKTGYFQHLDKIVSESLKLIGGRIEEEEDHVVAPH